jgi:hypothetical protein
MRRTALPLLFLLSLGVFALAQTSTTVIESACGRSVSTCNIYTADGGRVDLNNHNPLYVFSSQGVAVTCPNADVTSYVYTVNGPMPSRSNPADVGWTLHVACDSVVLDVQGHAHYSPYKYAGVYYFADSGTVSY